LLLLISGGIAKHGRVEDRVLNEPAALAKSESDVPLGKIYGFCLLVQQQATVDRNTLHFIEH
jgi:hypothetical protein